MTEQEKKKTFSFEKSVQQIETIINGLENGSIDQLDEMLKLFENGSVLLKKCYQYLEEAEMKVNAISKAVNLEKRDIHES